MPSLLRAQHPGDDLHGSMPTGPLPQGDSPPGVMTTGAVPVVDAPPDGAAAPLSALQTALQAVVVGLAALVVGLVVFTAVRAVAGDDDPLLADPDEREQGLPTVDPGPGDPGRTEGDSGDGRGTAALDGDGPGDAEDTDGTATAGGRDTDDATDGDTDSQTSTSGPVEGLSSPTGVDGGRLPGSGTPAPAGPSTTASPSPSLPFSRPLIITPEVSTSPPSPSATAGTTATTASTWASSTTRSSTTRPTTTLPPTTTTTRPAPSALIASPADGAVLRWESSVALATSEVVGATQYCWQLTGLDARTLEWCTSSSSTSLAASSRNPGVGPITVEAEARDASGSVLRSQRIGIRLVASDVITSPTAGAQLQLGRNIRLSARSLPGADQYCWTLSQGTTSSGAICNSGPTLNLNRSSSALDPFTAGSVTIRVEATRGGTVLGRQSVGATLVT